MNYCKITTSGQAMAMPNPYRLTIANANETQKMYIAKLDNWLVRKDTECPSYDPETHYATYQYVQDGSIEPTTQIPYAVQTWTIHPIEEPEQNEPSDEP